MKRADGRQPQDIRPFEVKTGIIPNAKGSAMVKMGKSIAIAGVYGPREYLPRHKQKSDRAVLRCIYTMVPFSTEDRVRPGPSRRSTEISMVITQALEPVVFLEEFPTSVIDVYINVIQADAGTRTAGINAASAALADAGIPMRDLVAAVAVGKIDDTFVADMSAEEEKTTKADLPIAYLPRSKKISLLQMDGDFSRDDIKHALDLATKSCKQIYEAQKNALKDRWKVKS